MNKTRFTIIEVTIALSIIAVIFIITAVPSIKANYKKHELYEQFYKSLTEINMTINTSTIENGTVNKWNFYKGNTERIFNEYFKPYFNEANSINCNSFENNLVLNLSGDKAFRICDIYGLSAKIPNGILKIKNGATFGITDIDEKNKSITVILDINGFLKPNIIGRDIFNFKVNESTYMPSVEAGIENQNCSIELLPKDGVIQGQGCADRILKEKKMNY